VTNECSLAVGIRNSTDQSYPIGFAVGERVFVGHWPSSVQPGGNEGNRAAWKQFTIAPATL
jgi:hypothetical protein